MPPHKDKIGVSIPVEALSEREIAWVEIYPWITQYSASLQAGKWWDTIEVKDWNFEVNGSMQFSGGAVLQNLSKHLVTDTYYIITLSDELGRVVLSDTGYVDYIWPEEEILFASALQDVPFTEYFPDTSPSATQEPSATPPQARGFGGLARPMSQDTYPIETPPTNTPEPTEIVETPEPPGDDSTPESPTDETTSPEQTPQRQLQLLIPTYRNRYASTPPNALLWISSSYPANSAVHSWVTIPPLARLKPR